MSDRAEEIAKEALCGLMLGLWVDLNDENRRMPSEEWTKTAMTIIASKLRMYAEEAVNRSNRPCPRHKDEGAIVIYCQTCLSAAVEEARREERDIAAKDAQMRYEDGYDCGVKDERETHRCQLPPGIQEALNSGDGSYHP